VAWANPPLQGARPKFVHPSDELNFEICSVKLQAIQILAAIEIQVGEGVGVRLGRRRVSERLRSSSKFSPLDPFPFPFFFSRPCLPFAATCPGSAARVRALGPARCDQGKRARSHSNPSAAAAFLAESLLEAPDTWRVPLAIRRVADIFCNTITLSGILPQYIAHHEGKDIPHAAFATRYQDHLLHAAIRTSWLDCWSGVRVEL
jgi:hypothetical protein